VAIGIVTAFVSLPVLLCSLSLAPTCAMSGWRWCSRQFGNCKTLSFRGRPQPNAAARLPRQWRSARAGVA